MKRTGILFLLGLLIFRGYGQDSSIDTLASIPAHPRLLLSLRDERRIRETVAKDPTWKEVQQAILLQCDSLVQLAPSQRVMGGIRLDPNRYCLYRVFYLSYAWRITREKKYFDQAEKELLAIAGFSDWNPSHYLDVVELTMASAIGYDWLYNELPETERHTVREAILTKGIRTSYDTAYHAYRKWLSVTNNWNQVCNTGISYGAMAIYESDPVFARQVINRSLHSIVISMKDYEPDGAYAEGYSYWGYGTMYNVIFIDGLQKMFGKDFGLGDQAGFLRSAAYMENMIGPTGRCFNYSDALPLTTLQPAMFWFARKLQDPSLLFEERRLLTGAALTPQLTYRFLPALLIWGCGTDMGAIHPPKVKRWVGAGRNPVSLMRTSWTDPDAIYLGLKGGSPSVTHGHMDAGSFVLEAEGQRWAMDFGYQDYNSLESKNINLWEDRQGGQRWQVFRYTNQVHNTLTIDGQEQNVKGSAPLTGTTKDPSFMSTTLDLSSLYKGQHKGELVSAMRGVAICEGKYVLVRDEIASGDSAVTVRWSMLTPAAVAITGKKEATLTLNGRKLRMVVEGPGAVEMKTWVTDPPPHDYDSPNPGTVVVGFVAYLPAKSKIAYNVLLIPEKAGDSGKPEKADLGFTKNNKPLAEWK